MKRFLIFVCAIAVALSLAIPGVAKEKDQAAPKKAEAATAEGHGKAHQKPGKKKGAAKAEAAASEEHGKAHEQHAKKKGAEKGAKAGQQETTPTPQQ
ncbi:MAG: hypothetical protein ACE145_05775 [Terriglobia bacterium]